MHRSRRRVWALLAPVALLATACGGASRYQGMDADALYAMAQAEVDQGHYDDAAATLERLIASYGGWNRLAEARLLLARTYFEDGQYLTARSEYQRFLDRYRGHPLSPDAALGECRSLAQLRPIPQRDQTFTQEGITVCGNVVIDYAGTPQAAEAATIRQSLRSTMAEKEYDNADAYFRRKFYDSAIIYYQFVVDLYPETDFAARALLGIYRANAAIGYDDLAQEARDRLLLEYPDSDAAHELPAEEPGT